MSTSLENNTSLEDNAARENKTVLENNTPLVTDVPTHLEEREAEAPTYTVTNWILALCLLPAAVLLVGFAYAQVLNAGCADGSCPGMGSGESKFAFIVMGAPAVALATIAASFLTARQRLGVLVPACGWTLLLILAATLFMAVP
jgi:hypothetical protein